MMSPSICLQRALGMRALFLFCITVLEGFVAIRRNLRWMRCCCLGSSRNTQVLRISHCGSKCTISIWPSVQDSEERCWLGDWTDDEPFHCEATLSLGGWWHVYTLLFVRSTVLTLVFLSSLSRPLYCSSAVKYKLLWIVLVQIQMFFFFGSD